MHLVSLRIGPMLSSPIVPDDDTSPNLSGSF